MRARRLIVGSVAASLCVMVSALALSSTVAWAGVRASLVSSFGSFGSGTGIAVEQATGDVFVHDGGTEALYKFNSGGEPVEFAASKTNVVEGVGGGPFGQDGVAVDESASGSARGDIYVANPNGGTIGVYGADGSPLGVLNGEVENEVPGAPWGEPCGVAVDSAGDVYVAMTSGHVNKYVPTGNPVRNVDYSSTLSGLGEVCGVAVSAEGSVYTDTWFGGPVMTYQASQFGLPAASGVLTDETGTALAVDPAANELVVDERGDVALFSAAGSLLGRFAASGAGALKNSFGVAANGAAGEVYVSNPATEDIEIFKVAVLPDVTTGGAAGVGAPSATLEGTVNPLGETVEKCVFEYGASMSYGATTPCASLPSGSEPVAVSTAIASLEPNTVYHYRLVASTPNGTAEGQDQTFVSFAPGPSLDAARAASATNVTPSTATLNGSINPHNDAAGYHFVYGLTTAYGSIVPVPDLYTPVNNTDDPVVPQTLNGLQPGTTYHFALVASSASGTVTGPDETFTTPAIPPPAVSTGGAGEVTLGGARLTGTVDPEGYDTVYRFEYGTSTAYGSEWPTVDVQAGQFSSPQPVTIAVQNLQPGTTYHYRLVATNPAGTVYGADQMFTTPSYPVSIVAETPILGAPVKSIAIKPTTETLTSAQKLSKALKACKGQPKSKQAKCERQARKRYVPAKKRKT